jgi:phosphoribosyl 1,2-cyclic phosphate phosphodiesterase
MTVTLLGTGTSMGVPVLACDCEVCRSTDPHDQRLRTSALIQDASRSILIDCGPDFRTQGLRAGLDRLDGVLLTHAHSDHTAGLDDLRIFNFRTKRALPIHAQREVLDWLRVRFDYAFSPEPPKGGGVPSFDLREADAPFGFLGLRIVPIPVLHGDLPIIGYRFGRFAYVTDASQIPEESFALLRGVDTLVLNALRPRPHPTHFSLPEAVAAAERIGAARTWFVHMTHDMLHAPTNAALPPHIQLGHDGLTFEIEAEDA